MKKLAWLLIFLTLVISITSLPVGFIYSQDNPKILPGRIVVRFEAGVSPEDIFGKGSSKSKSIQPEFAVKSITRALEWTGTTSLSRGVAHPLSDIFFIETDTDEDILPIIQKLNNLEGVRYAEPYYLVEMLNGTNDPLAAEQEHIELIQAARAWDLEKGDSTVVIAILDSGVNPNHPDLIQNLAINSKDPVNGIDDDGDGLTDNYIGWDIADNDNNPFSDTDPHGSWVTGVSNAGTNNGTGISGTGYSIKFMPVKIFKSNTNAFSRGYEAIALAADLGCKVINLSWGSENSFTQFGQDIINYAVLEKDAAVIAAAGNTDGSRNFYPASYDNVLSVAASDFGDHKASWSTYGPYVDIIAPGTGILTTDNSNGYIRRQGTSLSAPQVAGAVALVRSRFPELNARQAMERVRVYSDPVYNVGQNSTYSRLLGKGRLNMYQALAGITSPAVRLTDLQADSGVGNNIFFGDTIKLSTSFANYLYQTQNLQIELVTSSPYVQLIRSTFNAGVIRTMESREASEVFSFYLDEDTPPDQEILLTLLFKDGSYQDYQHFYIRTNPDRVEVRGGELALTIAGNGNLAYAEDYFFQGNGLTFKDSVILKNAALMLSSGGKVSDNMPGNLLAPARDGDFTNELPIKLKGNTIADRYAAGSFNSIPIDGLTIEQEVMAWEDNDAVVIEYRVTNESGQDFDDLSIGFFNDFELRNPLLNRNFFIDSLKLSVTHDHDQQLFAGVAEISGNNIKVFAVDKRNANGNASDIPGSINDQVKEEILRRNDPPTSAGMTGDGNDVASFLISDIPLDNGLSKRLTYAIVAGHSLSEIIDKLKIARDRYNDFLNEPPVLYTAEYCENSAPIIDPPGDIFEFYLDPKGSLMIATGNMLSGPGLDTLDNIYVRTLAPTGVVSDIFRIPIRQSVIVADFTTKPDTLLLDENNNTLVKFNNATKGGEKWSWKFSNGYASTLRSPSINFTEPGTYEVKLSATNKLGCKNEITRDFHVFSRTPKPEEIMVGGCAPLDAEIPAKENMRFKLYGDAEKTIFLGSFDSLILPDILQDSVLYYTSTTTGGFESLPSEIKFDIYEVESSFSWIRDSTNLSTTTLLHFESASNSGDINWYIDINGQKDWIGFGKNISADYSGLEAFRIFSETTTSQGCVSENSEYFEPKVSPPVTSENLTVCKGSRTTITPSGGEFFHFYSIDGELIAKGRDFLLSDIENDTTVIVANATDLLEGDKSTFRINISVPDASFLLPQSPFNMANGIPLNISPSDTNISFYEWKVNNQTAGFEDRLIHYFDNPGTYAIDLTVTDSIGCTATARNFLEVVNITSGEESLSDEISLYPNPANDHLILMSSDPIELVLASDIAGRLMRKWNFPDKAIDLRELPEGIYIFEVFTRNKHFIERIVFQKP